MSRDALTSGAAVDRRRRLRRPSARASARLVRRRPAAVQARPDGAPHPHLRRSAAAPTPRRPTSRCLRARPRRARRVPRPRDDQRLPAVAQPGAVERAAAATSCPSSPPTAAACAPGAPAAPTAPRPTRSPRSAAEAIPARARRRSSAPTSTAAWSSAPAPARFSAEDARDAPAGALRALVRRRPTAAGRPTPSCARIVRFERRRPAAHAPAGGRLRPRPVPQHRHLLHRGRPRRAARAARRRRCAPAATSSSAPPSASPTRARSASSPPVPFIYRKAADGHLRVPPDVPGRGREHLQELNLAVVRIEETPDDRETVDEIFRIAHSLKGMSATMGFDGMAALTHEMEDVFELLRQRTRRPRARGDRRPARVPRRARGRRRRDRGRRRGATRPRAARSSACRRLVRDARRRAARPSAPARRRRPTTSPSWPTAAASCRSRATLADDVAMPAVRAYMVLAALAELGETLACRPAAGRRRGLRRPRGRRLAGHRAHRRRAGRRRRAPSPTSPTSTSSRPSPTPRVDERRGGRRRRPRAAGGRRPAAAAAARPAARHGRRRPSASTPSASTSSCTPWASSSCTARTSRRSPPRPTCPGLAQAMQDLTRTSQALQAMVMQVRMIPVEAVFLRFPRLVRDLVGQARQAGRARARRQGHRARPHRRRRARRPARAPRPQLARPRPRGARTSASPPASPPTGTLEISARHAGGNVVITVARRRPRHRPRARRRARPSSAG